MCIVLIVVCLVLVDLAFNTFTIFVPDGGGLVALFGEGAYQTADLCVSAQKENIKTYWYFIVLYCWWVVSLASVPVLMKQ